MGVVFVLKEKRYKKLVLFKLLQERDSIQQRIESKQLTLEGQPAS